MIRIEESRDVPAIRRVNLAAFDTPAEADLVDALRAASLDPFISIVAESDREIVGHILFTPVTVHPANGQPWPAAALGPMAVLPSYQRSGIGSALVRAGLEACRTGGQGVVFVLGHPRFYPRFGFWPARPMGLDCTWDVPDEVFMVAECPPGAGAGGLAGRTGCVRYHSLFHGV